LSRMITDQARSTSSRLAIRSRNVTPI
jgi:hypothetical protein